MRRYGSKQRTAKDRTSEMVQFLTSPMLSATVRDRLTVDTLVGRYGVDRKVAEYHLWRAQNRAETRLAQ